MKSNLITVLSLVSVSLARPDRSPVCKVEDAVEKIRASPMGTTVQNISQDYSFTIEKTSYAPGDQLRIKIDGKAPFQGFLMYAVGSEDQRIGKFEIPQGMQNNAQVCTNSEFPESSLTHTPGQKFTPPLSFNYTATNDHGKVWFNAIIVQKLETGYNWAVYRNVMSVNSNQTDCQEDPAPTTQTYCTPTTVTVTKTVTVWHSKKTPKCKKRKKMVKVDPWEMPLMTPMPTQTTMMHHQMEQMDSILNGPY